MWHLLGVLYQASLLFLASVLAVGVFWLSGFILKIRNLYKRLSKCPGFDNKDFSWIFGNLHKIPEEGHDRLLFFQNMMRGPKRCEKFFLFWSGPFSPRLFLFHPDTIKEICQTTEPKQGGLFSGYRMSLPWLGDGLLISGGAKWARSRRLLTPAFHFDILRSYIDVYNDAANQFLNNAASHAESGKSLEIFGPVSSCTLDIMLRCAFSYEANCQNPGEMHPYVTAVKELARLISQRFKRPWLFPDITFNLSQTGREFYRYCNYVHKFAEDVIAKRKQDIETKGIDRKKYLDFLDILLTARDENGEGLSDMEIRNEVDTFLFEGHDTTASAISWITYSLAIHQEYQEKAYEEVKDIMSGREGEEIVWDDLNKMDMLTQCIKEGLRLHSPVPLIGRDTKEAHVIDGIDIPAGVSVTFNFHALHNNPDIWQNPTEFNPERFSKSNSAGRDPFMFTPFSAGPRNCIGQNFAMNEMKVFMAKLLYRYHVTLDESHEVRHVPSMVMRAKNGIKVFVSPRKQLII